MPIIRWKPFDPVEEYFNDYYGKQFISDLGADIYEDGDKLYIEVTVAGLKPEDIDIEVHDNILRVQGTREDVHEKKGKNYLRKEIRRGRFEREIILPFPVEGGKEAKAEYHHGILTIILTKEHTKQPNKIKVQNR